MPLPSTPENWRPTAHSDQYLVSTSGEVWSVLSGKVLRSKKSKTGYLTVTLKQETGTFYIHSLVAVAWLGPPPSPHYVVDHIDHNKTNNHVSNLEWVTREENARRAAAVGALKERKRGRKSSLTTEQVYAARTRRLNGEPVASIASEFGVDLETVRNAVHGKTYKDLAEVPPLPLLREPGTWRPGSGGKRREGPAKATDEPPTVFIEPVSGEDWRRLPGDLAGYWVSSQGRVFSAKSRRLMQPQTTNTGYLRVQLRTPTGHTNKMIHVLVAENFLGTRPEGLVAGHLNENSQDPRRSNLAWISRKENAVRASIADRRSVKVLELQDFVASHVAIERMAKLSNIVVDAYVPSLKLVVQYDQVSLAGEIGGGVSRSQRVKDMNTLWNEHQVRTIRLFSTEWKKKNDLVKSVLLHKLGLTSTKVYARKTQVQEVATSDATNFLNTNHMQGAVGGSVKLGCYHDGELVALAVFGVPRFGKSQSGSFELLRYANKINCSVIGGFSKLLAHFIAAHKPKHLISFADRRWSSGGLYEACGFKLTRTSAPNYFYFHPREPDNLRSRVQFQRHRLPALLPVFDPTKTEVENMVANGWDRIWDCGSLVYEMDPTNRTT